MNYNLNLYLNNIHQPNYLRNNGFQREYYKRPHFYSKAIISDHNRNKLQIIKKISSNKFESSSQSDSNLNYRYHNPIINHYNKDYVNKNKLNLSADKINEFKNRTKINFYSKHAEDYNIRILTEKNKRLSNFDREILKVFIYIYYYEKIAGERNIFNNEEDFYLINPKWFKKFKEFYSYDKLKKRFDNLSKVYNYNILDYGIKFILDTLSAENILRNVEIFPDLKEIKLINTIATKEKGIIYTNPGIIIPGKIMDIIKNFNFFEFQKIQPKIFYFISNLVYYINSSKKIIVGYLKDNIEFIPNFIFEFNNDLEEYEIKHIIFTPINDYIIQNKCNPKKFFQPILNEKNQQIGNLLILNQRRVNSSKFLNRNALENNQIKNKKNELINRSNNLVNQLKKLEKELASKNKENENIKNELNNLINEKNYLIKDKEDKSKEIAYLKNKINQLDNNTDNLNKLQQNQIAINKDLNEKQKNLNELNEKCKILFEKKTNLEKENLNLKNINNKLNIQLQQYKAQISNSNEIINKMKTNYNNFNNEINSLKRELNQKNDEQLNINKIKGDLDNLQEVNRKLNQQLEDKNKEINNIKAQRDQLIRNDNDIKIIKNIENEINKKKQELNEKQKDYKNLENQVLNLSKEKEKLLGEIKRINGQEK